MHICCIILVYISCASRINLALQCFPTRQAHRQAAGRKPQTTNNKQQTARKSTPFVFHGRFKTRLSNQTRHFQTGGRGAPLSRKLFPQAPATFPQGSMMSRKRSRTPDGGRGTPGALDGGDGTPKVARAKTDGGAGKGDDDDDDDDDDRKPSLASPSPHDGKRVEDGETGACDAVAFSNPCACRAIASFGNGFGRPNQWNRACV